MPGKTGDYKDLEPLSLLFGDNDEFVRKSEGDAMRKFRLYLQKT